MDFARKRIFYDKQEFQLAWEGVPPSGGFFGHFRHHPHAPREVLSEAGHFLGGALLVDGFTIFRNGGVPLLERRFGPVIEEIVLRASPYVQDEPFLPIRAHLHLSHSGLLDTRLRYWKPASRAPSFIVSLDLGELEFPPCWVIWNVGIDYQVLVDLLDWVRRLALPWFRLFEHPEELRTRLFQGTVSGLDQDRSLEMVLTEFGTGEAMRYLEECVLADKTMGPRILEASKRMAIIYLTNRN